MTTWTDAAREQLEAYFARLTPSLREGGADPTEVIEDLRRTLDREAQAEGLTIVTEPDLKRLLAKIGAPEPGSNTPETTSTPAANGATPVTPDPAPSPAERRRRPGFWLLFSGVVLPLIAFLFEWATGMCAAAFFDPMPTLGYELLVVAVPVINLVVWLAMRREVPRVTKGLVWANGVAAGAAAFFALQFVPLLLPGLLAVVWFGWGLLPWAPMLSLVAAVGLRRHLRRAYAPAGPMPWPRTWPGLLAAVAILVGMGFGPWTSRVALVRAAATEPEVRQGGLAWLRTLGHHETLLRACYGRNQWAADMDLVGWLLTNRKEVPPADARQIYYRVYGRPFNAVPPPEIRSPRGQRIGFDAWTWDADQGGQQVGGRLRGLHLHGSRLDATVEAAAALAYVEWTLEFRNDATEPQEARAQVLLPPNGVVSRLTLWVNGEEREAAFASRSRVRQAYQTVAIQKRRDPVLVTTAGPDRVLVQCFPVPAHGTMKVRLGITAPLPLRATNEALLRWPQIIERNFSVAPEFRHGLWLDSLDATGLTCPALKSDAANAGGRISLHGDVTERQLADATTVTTVRRNERLDPIWVTDSRADNPQAVRQFWARETRPPTPGFCLVLDASAPLREEAGRVAAALEQLPGETRVQLFVGADGNQTPSGPATEAPAAIAQRIRRLRFSGGQDNTTALTAAWDAAAKQPGTVVIWVHGPQPVLLGSEESLRQRMERAPDGPLVCSFQTTAGPDRLLERLDGLPRIRCVPRFGPVDGDLTAFFKKHLQPSAELLAVREARPAADAPVEPGKAAGASFHLVRLWAYDRIRNGQLADEAAVRLAMRYQLVAPVSGAVVLETKQQYREAGLQAAAKDSTPSMAKPGLEVAAQQPLQEIQVVPEPGTISLLILGAACLGVRGLRHRQRK